MNMNSSNDMPNRLHYSIFRYTNRDVRRAMQAGGNPAQHASARVEFDAEPELTDDELGALVWRNLLAVMDGKVYVPLREETIPGLVHAFALRALDGSGMISVIAETVPEIPPDAS